MHILDFPWAVLRLKEVEHGKGWAGMGRWSWIGLGLDSPMKEFGQRPTGCGEAMGVQEQDV